jgi:hypothetical protein
MGTAVSCHGQLVSACAPAQAQPSGGGEVRGLPPHPPWIWDPIHVLTSPKKSLPFQNDPSQKAALFSTCDCLQLGDKAVGGAIIATGLLPHPAADSGPAGRLPLGLPLDQQCRIQFALARFLIQV